MGQQRVIISAGASGIGLAIAEVFAERGASVAVCDVDLSAIAAASAAHPTIRFERCDVSDVAVVDRFVADAVGAMGGVDVLVNNAGVAGPRGPIEENDPAEWAACFAVNVAGAFHLIRAVTPLMKAQGVGSIVNISTASTVTGLPNRSAYVSSKWALEGLTRNAARELGPSGIRVNAIRPGFMDNPRMTGILTRIAEERGLALEEVEAEALGYISLRTKIQPREIGEMAFFLASPTAAHVTGQIIGVDGNSEWEG